MNGADELIKRYQGYAEALARDIAQRLPRQVGLEDLLASAVAGLVQAANRFDPTRGVSFKTFAYYRIRGEVFDYLEAAGFGHASAELSVVDDALGLHAESPPALAPAAAAAAFEQVLGRVAVATAMLDTPSCAIAAPAAEEDPSQLVEARELQQRLRVALGTLPENEAAIVRLHYFEHASLTECARKLGMHKAWISRLHARALDRLRGVLSSSEVTSASPADCRVAVTT